MTNISIETPNGSIGAVLETPPGKGPWPGVVVIHDAFGLREPHRAIARQIADNGYLAIAPNLFARGGVIRCMRAVMSDLMAFEGQAFEDVTAARQLLSKRSDCTGAIGVAGFCMGGGFALIASTKGFDASAPFYPPPLQSKYSEIVDGACPIVASFVQRLRSPRTWTVPSGVVSVRTVKPRLRMVGPRSEAATPAIAARSGRRGS